MQNCKTNAKLKYENSTKLSPDLTENDGKIIPVLSFVKFSVQVHDGGPQIWTNGPNSVTFSICLRW